MHCLPIFWEISWKRRTGKAGGPVPRLIGGQSRMKGFGEEMTDAHRDSRIWIGRGFCNSSGLSMTPL